MKDERKQWIIDNYINGNYGDFKKAIKACSKLDVLDLIEYYSGNVGSRHIIINAMRRALA